MHMIETMGGKMKPEAGSDAIQKVTCQETDEETMDMNSLDSIQSASSSLERLDPNFSVSNFHEVSNMASSFEKNSKRTKRSTSIEQSSFEQEEAIVDFISIPDENPEDQSSIENNSIFERENAFERMRKRNRRYTPSPLNHPKKIRRRNFNSVLNRRKTWWLISADNRIKVSWDIMTAILSICSILYTNRAIQTKSYEQSSFVMFCEVWFLVDICLNFVTEHKTINGDVICDGKAVWARYLTTWFPIDVLSLIPWERIFVKPIVEMQKKRGFFKKSFFRTKAVFRVTRKLRGGHFKLFGRIANKSKHAGVGGRKLLTYIIKYVPKYVMFYRNMKGVLAVRLLRQIHWLMKIIKNSLISPRNLRRNLQGDGNNFERRRNHYEASLEKITEIKPFLGKQRTPYESKSERTYDRAQYSEVTFADRKSKKRQLMEDNFKEEEEGEEEDFGLGVY